MQKLSAKLSKAAPHRISEKGGRGDRLVLLLNIHP